MTLKVMTIVGTRPEIIKLSSVIPLFDSHFNHILVHSGQNYDYELNEVFFNDLGLRKPDFFLNAAGKTAAETISNVILKSTETLLEQKPDALLLYGDTNSCLSVIAAKKLQIPIFHMEAGNRCFDQRVPEEVNRKIVDHLSDINMVHSEHARNYLLREGINPELVIKTGSPMVEVLNFHKSKIEKCEILNKLDLKEKEYFLVSIHREENVDYEDNFRELLGSLNGIANEFGLRVIVSTHPRTRKRLEAMTNIKMNKLIEFMKPMGFIDYNKLQLSAKCVISDSGTITEESSILKFPAITIRQAHERPEGMDAGTLIMSGLKKERVIESIKISISQNEKFDVPFIKDYSSNQVSFQVLKIVQSYTDYINRVIWRKSENRKFVE